MAANFNYLNLHTEYSCVGEFELKTGNGGAACFSSVFGKTGDVGTKVVKETYTIYLYAGTNALEKVQYNNACIFSEDEIKKHMEVAKKEIHPFNYTLEKKEVQRNGKKLECYLLVLDIEAKFVYHKILLSWARCLYEWPFNIVLREAYNLKGTTGFKRETMINLYTIASGCFPINDRLFPIHYFRKGGYLMTKAEFQEKLKSLEDNKDRYNTLNKVFSRSDIPAAHVLKGDNNTFFEIEYWENKDNFNQRLVQYKKTYEYLKDKKKKDGKQEN